MGSFVMLGSGRFGRVLLCAGTLFLAGVSCLQAAGRDTLKVYLDADFAITQTSSNAILLGIRTALDELGGEIAGHPIEVVPMDHRGSPKRSAHTMRRFLSDPAGIAVFGGMQSPPYLTNGEYINASGIPLLLPWSAAGPLTRLAEGERNFVFRLSVDDTKAGGFLIRTALAHECKSIALLLSDTGWGRANRTTVSEAARAIGFSLTVVEMVDPNLGPLAAQGLARTVAGAGVDCAITVVTPGTAKELFPALIEAASPLRVFSHWGILGNDFMESLPHGSREALDVRVLQTCALELERTGNPLLEAVLAGLEDPEVDSHGLSGIPASVGFVNAYDLTMVLGAAIDQAAKTREWGTGPEGRRLATKRALEALEVPVEGILRTYAQPFSPVSADTPDGHEALGAADLCVAKYHHDGRLIAAPRDPMNG